MSVSSNIFQFKLDAFYKNVKNVNEITDDIHILGYENDDDHDITLPVFLKVTSVKGLKIGFHKVQYKVNMAQVFGATITTGRKQLT